MELCLDFSKKACNMHLRINGYDRSKGLMHIQFGLSPVVETNTEIARLEVLSSGVWKIPSGKDTTRIIDW